MPRKKKTAIELGQEIPTSVIAVQREYQLTGVDFYNPKDLDALYATVPELSRAVDLRGSAMICRGYEITPRNDSDEAKQFANLCAWVLNNSGGVAFIEQWHKNTDLYGDGYVELTDDNGKVVELAHIHAYNFGYILEENYDTETNKWTSKIKLDKETQKPVGYATYKVDENRDGILVNNKKYDLDRVVHLKYKVIGDGLYGISIAQPMQGSIVRKLKIEDSIEAASRTVASPKIVIKGEFGTNEEALQQAREAASLDVNDVVILQNGKEFEFVTPGDIALPELREIFVKNITTACGIPRPLLTSEGTEVNKATLDVMLLNLRENMRSNMEKMKAILELKIFKKIGETWNIQNIDENLPHFDFPEEFTAEEMIITREEKKAATLTSLSNSIQILSNSFMNLSSTGSDLQTSLITAITKTAILYSKTVDTFNVNNDQESQYDEETTPKEAIKSGKNIKLNLSFFNDANGTSNPEPELTPAEGQDTLQGMTADGVKVDSSYTTVTLIDDIWDLKNPEKVSKRHELMHELYPAIIGGAEIFDIQTGKIITIPEVAQKHRQYVLAMQSLGMIHQPSEKGADLDMLLEYL